MDRNVLDGLMAFAPPSDEELRASAQRRYEISGPFNIDRWPAAVAALSMPTKMVEVEDRRGFLDLWDGPGEALALHYAAKLDALMGMDQHFIRLNSRSPKDAAYPSSPITCAGKQAMWWISASERCLDDSVTHAHADAPLFICAREWRPIRPEFEFRCFAKGGQVLAVSRYDYHNPSKLDGVDTGKLMDAAKAFYARHLSDHYGDVVFDIHALGTAQELLIELNPYGLSDPCLFTSYDQVEQGGVRL